MWVKAQKQCLQTMMTLHPLMAGISQENTGLRVVSGQHAELEELRTFWDTSSSCNRPRNRSSTAGASKLICLELLARSICSHADPVPGMTKALPRRSRTAFQALMHSSTTDLILQLQSMLTKFLWMLMRGQLLNKNQRARHMNHPSSSRQLLQY
jgi:hypothetical protein